MAKGPIGNGLEQSYPVNIEADRTEGVFHFARKKVRAALGKYLAETAVRLRKKDGFVDCGSVLEADKLHRLFVFGRNNFARHIPPDGGHAAPDVLVQGSSPDVTDTGKLMRI